MNFSRVYIENVLAENFEDAKRLFFPPLMAIHRAHLVMLAQIGVIGREEAVRLREALQRIDWAQVESMTFDGSFEDLFYCVEQLLTEHCGESTAGQLHTARSRNDIDVTLYRMRWREELLHVARAALCLRETLLGVCSRELETLFPVHTHTQPAQPSTIAHYFHAMVEHLERDHLRIRSAFGNLNRCPLGSCAATGTGFPIDRQVVSRLLAFDGPTGNTYASIAGVDYLLEAVSAMMVLLSTLGKLLHDLLVWSMAELGFLRLDEGFVQRSSIMPQKRNPVALEHSRALASKALGEGSAVFMMLHNTPFGDIVDVEDDLQPLVQNLFKDTRRTLELLAAALSNAAFDRHRLEKLAADNGITMTELADTLVRREGLSFRQAHRAAAAVSAAVRSPGADLAQVLREATKAVGREIEYSGEDLEEILSPRNFVAIRRHLGGPAPVTVSEALDESQRLSVTDRDWVEQQLERLKVFPAELDKAVQQI